MAATLYHTGFLRLFHLVARHFLRLDGVIVCYHRVLPSAGSATTDYAQLGIVSSLEHFRRQLRYLLAHLDVVSLHDYLARPMGRRSRLVCAITFEDGWADNYRHAYPVLRERRVPATIFVTTDFVDKGHPFWHTILIYLLLHGDLSRLRLDQLEPDILPDPVARSLASLTALGRPPGVADLDDLIETLKAYDEERIGRVLDHLAARLNVPMEPLFSRRFALTWDEIREMAAHGIEFGAHGATHRILTTLSPAEIWEEAVRAKEALERRLGTPVSSFLCPNGNGNPTIHETLTSAGYRYIFPATHGARTDPAARLLRINVHDGLCAGPFGGFSLALFAFEASGLKQAILRPSRSGSRA